MSIRVCHAICAVAAKLIADYYFSRLAERHLPDLYAHLDEFVKNGKYGLTWKHIAQIRQKEELPWYHYMDCPLDCAECEIASASQYAVLANTAADWCNMSVIDRFFRLPPLSLEMYTWSRT